MQYRRLVIIPVLFFSLILQACTFTLPPDNAKETVPPLTPSETVVPLPSSSTEYSANEIGLYKNFNLADNEMANILSVKNNRVLINVYTDYSVEDPLYRETGYNSKTKRIELYDLQSQTIVSSLTKNNTNFCTNAVLLENGEFVYVVVSRASGAASSGYKIIKVKDLEEVVITDGVCIETGYDDPKLAALENGAVAFSYTEEGTGRFGVNIIFSDNTIKQQISLQDDGSTQHLRTTLVGNGEKYIYYAAVDGQGTIFIANETELLSTFTLPNSERVYEYCFLDDMLFFTMQINDGSVSTKKIIIKNFEGENLFETECDALYRMSSNNVDTVLGIDGNYQVYAAQLQNDSIIIQKIDVPTTRLVIFNLDITDFALYYYSKASDNKVVILTIEHLLSP